MLDFTQEIEDLKLKNDDLINFTIRFTEDEIYLTGEFHEDGEVDDCYCGKLASFFIPTAKGYVSAEWKKTKFWNMNRELVTENLLIELEPYLQSEKPKTFIRDTGDGWGVAGAIANHINANGGDPYNNQ
tara:strand:+ start:66 stop:452 length:387 start_codon:yes stop_codon:yes gene_type:complete